MSILYLDILKWVIFFMNANDFVKRNEYILCYGRDLLYFFDLSIYIAIYHSDILRKKFIDLGMSFVPIQFSTYESCIYQYMTREDEDWFAMLSKGEVTRKDIYDNIDDLLKYIDAAILEYPQTTDLVTGICMAFAIKGTKRVDIYIDNEVEAVMVLELLQSENNPNLRIITNKPETYDDYTCIIYGSIKQLEEDYKANKLKHEHEIGIALTGYNTKYSPITNKRHIKFVYDEGVDLPCHAIGVFNLFADNTDFDIYG
nr:MAG TPA: hypothetical protein [Caudoviricetes sp.]